MQAHQHHHIPPSFSSSEQSASASSVLVVGSTVESSSPASPAASAAAAPPPPPPPPPAEALPSPPFLSAELPAHLLHHHLQHQHQAHLILPSSCAPSVVMQAAVNCTASPASSHRVGGCGAFGLFFCFFCFFFLFPPRNATAHSHRSQITRYVIALQRLALKRSLA